MAQEYYTDEITAVPFGPLYRALSAAVPPPLAIGLAGWFRLRKMLNWPLKPTYASGGIDSGRVIERSEVPPRTASRWAPFEEQLADLNFRPLKYELQETIGAKEQVAAVYLDPIGSTIAVLEWIRMRGADGLVEKTPLEFDSYAHADPEIMTASMAADDMNVADIIRLDYVDMECHVNTRPVREIYHRHLERTRGRVYYQMTPEAALAEHRKRSARRYQSLLESGLLRILRPHEVEEVRAIRLE